MVLDEIVKLGYASCMNLVITNRGLLRDFKSVKEKLLSGEVKNVRVRQVGGEVLNISLERKVTKFQSLVKRVREKPLIVRRPEEDLF